MIPSRLHMLFLISLVAGCSSPSFSASTVGRDPKDRKEATAAETENLQRLPGPPGSENAESSSELPPGEASRPDPKLQAVFNEVPNDLLGPAAVASVIWKTEGDEAAPEGWLARVEVKTLGSSQWSVVGSPPASDKKFSFIWGERPIGAFETRVTFVRDDKESTGIAASWSPHVFSAAILTRTVRCLFCHIRVEGDVGGIDFPIRDMHAASASGVRIFGQLFATGGVPEIFKTGVPGGTPVATAGFIENYRNTGKKIFPKPNAAGEIAFPTLQAGVLEKTMLGKMTIPANNVSKTTVTIDKVHRGSLFIDGSITPFSINGEVLIDGDLVIKGSYTGRGTIYAANIFIIGDVTAQKSPFPFVTNEAEAMEQARNSLVRGDDALYLASTKTIRVGEYATSIVTRIDSVNEFKIGAADLTRAIGLFGSEAALVAAAQRPLQASQYRNATPDLAPWTFTVNPKFRMDVVRVDAFLFASEGLVWHSHGNWLLNGGFISPNSALTSKMQAETGTWWCTSPNKTDLPDAIPKQCGKRPAILINPRNELPSHTNVIRYDYRLRAGGTGFESIRGLFE
jgi:hypothetical protein